MAAYRRGPTAAAALLAALVAGWVVVSALHRQVGIDTRVGPFGVVTSHRLTLADFRDTVFVPTRDLLAGHNPYDVTSYLRRHPAGGEFDLYAPWHLTLVAPVVLLPYRAAAAVWLLLQVAALVVLTRLLLRGLPPAWRGPAVGLTVAVVTGLFVGRENLTGGQATALVALGTGMFLLYARDRPTLAAAGLVLAAIKPQFGLVLLVAACAAGAWRALARAAVLAAVLGVPPLAVAVAAAGGFGRFLRTVRANLAYSASLPGTRLDGAQGRLDLVGTLARVSGGAPPPAVQVLVQLALAGAAAAAVLLLRRSRGGSGLRDPRTAVVVVAAVLLTGVHQVYDLLLVLVPAGLVLTAAVRAQQRHTTAWVAAAAVAFPLVHPRRLDSLLAGRPVSFDASAGVDSLWLLGLLLFGLAAVTLSLRPGGAPATTGGPPACSGSRRGPP